MVALQAHSWQHCNWLEHMPRAGPAPVAALAATSYHPLPQHLLTAQACYASPIQDPKCHALPCKVDKSSSTTAKTSPGTAAAGRFPQDDTPSG